MSETMKRFLGVATVPSLPLPTEGRELAVIPTAKSLPDLAADIRRLVLQSYAFGSMVSIDERAALIRRLFSLS